MKRSVFTFSAFAAFALFAAFATTSHADKRTHAAAKVSIDVPDGWKIDAEEDNMTITDAADECAIFFIVLETDDLHKALDAIDSELSKVAKNIKWEDKPSELKLNGMDAIALDGKGKIDGTDADMGVMLINTPADKILLVLGAVESAKSSKHEADVEKILKSIKPEK